MGVEPNKSPLPLADKIGEKGGDYATLLGCPGCRLLQTTWSPGSNEGL